MFRIVVPVVCLALLITACAGSEVEVPTAPLDLIEAREAAFDHIQIYYFTGPDSMLQWHEDRVVDEDLVDWVEYQYTADPWIATVGGPVIGSSAAYYDVVVTNPRSGLLWEGRVQRGGHVVEGSEQVLAACDAVCAYVAERFPEFRVGDLVWAGRRVTPAGLAGQETYEYTSGNWRLKVTYPVVAPDAAVYQVTVENEATGFVWVGEMDPDRHLVETGAYSLVPEVGSA